MSNVKNAHLGKNYAAETLARIEAKTIRDESTGCLVWQGATGGGDGVSAKCLYPSMHYQQRTARVTRVVYMLSYGEIPKGHDICHTCDNPLCVNLDHMFPGTRKRNMRDAIFKGRFKFLEHKEGSAHHHAAFTDAQVMEIRKRYAEGAIARVLAEEHGVSECTMKRLVSGATYANLPVLKREAGVTNNHFIKNNPRKRKE